VVGRTAPSLPGGKTERLYRGTVSVTERISFIRFFNKNRLCVGRLYSVNTTDVGSNFPSFV
jgi:hypothetical protein